MDLFRKSEKLRAPSLAIIVAFAMTYALLLLFVASLVIVVLCYCIVLSYELR